MSDDLSFWRLSAGSSEWHGTVANRVFLYSLDDSLGCIVIVTLPRLGVDSVDWLAPRQQTGQVLSSYLHHASPLADGSADGYGVSWDVGM